jgi:hypothetical protein
VAAFTVPDHEYPLKDEMDILSTVMKLGTYPLALTTTLGIDVNVLTKVTIVEPPEFVIDDPCCSV